MASLSFGRTTTERQAVRAAGRAGFAARGVVYLLVGALAVAIAVGRESGQADRQGALREIAARPFGTVVLWLLVAGFAGMTLWRAWTALRGEDGEKKTGKRLLNAGRAVFYATVCWGTAAFALGTGGGGSSDSSSKDWTASALGLPGGRFLVGAAGAVVAGIGVGIAVRAVRRKFLDRMRTGEMSRTVRRAVTAAGVAGNAARGAVFTAAGAFLVAAAVRFDPQQAKGVDDTLRSFAETPAGPWLLLAAAIGLVLFGGFSLACARWRRT